MVEKGDILQGVICRRITSESLGAIVHAKRLRNCSKG